MPSAGGMTFHGDKALMAALDGLGGPGARRAMRQALAPGASIISKAAKRGARARDWPGIALSIGRRKKTYKDDDNVVEVIGARYAYVWKKTGERPSTWAHAAEFGPNARPFFRAAVQMSEGDAFSAIRAKARLTIPKEAAKQARKRGGRR